MKKFYFFILIFLLIPSTSFAYFATSCGVVSLPSGGAVIAGTPTELAVLISTNYVGDWYNCSGDFVVNPDEWDIYACVCHDDNNLQRLLVTPAITNTCFGFDEDYYYAILSTVVCPNGDPVGMEYCACYDGNPQSSGSFCGNAATYSSMLNLETDGTINYPTVDCSYTAAQMQTLCEAIGQGSNCNNDFLDTDNDGVPDDEDQEPNSLPGAVVDENGVTIPDTGNDYTDSDGDGVPDSRDQEPDTPSGNTVDSDGNTITWDDNDPDPNTDNDDDGPLLSEIVEWLNQINQTNTNIDKNTDGLETLLNRIENNTDGIEEKLDTANDKLTSIDDVLNKTDHDQGDKVTDANSSISQAQSDIDSALTDLQNELSDHTFDLTDYSNAEEKTDVYDMIIDRLSDNPITTMINSIQLETSGTCELIWNYNGNPISFTMCNLDDELNAFGVILLMITSFSSFVMIVRR